MSQPDPAINASSRVLAARAWAEAADLIDRQLSPLGLAAMAVLGLKGGEVVLDVGCGSGQTLVQLAAQVGPAGRVVGIDIAAPLLDIARRRATHLPQVSLVEGDAQTAALEDLRADGVFSRFGVMAFADPVAAFANLRRILRPGGRLAFCCWRALEENELDRMPLEAAGLAHLADPAPFSFSDPAVVRRILEAAGCSGVSLRAHDEAVSSGGAEAMFAVLSRVGPLGRILRERPELLPAAEPRLRAALAGREHDGVVALGAAIWIVTASV